MQGSESHTMSPTADFPAPVRQRDGELTSSWDRDWQTESPAWETSLGSSLRSQAASGKLPNPKIAVLWDGKD